MTDTTTSSRGTLNVARERLNGHGPAPVVDAHALESALRERNQGEVRVDDGSRALYAADASN